MEKNKKQKLLKCNPRSDKPALLVSFPSGGPSSLSSDNDFALQVFQNPKRADHQMLVAEKDNLFYVGQSFGADGPQTTFSKYGVMLVHKKKSYKANDSSVLTAQLLDVSHLFAMRPKLLQQAADENSLKENEEKKAEEKEKEKKKDAAQQYTESKSELIDHFGSKKRKRQMKRQLENRIRLDNEEAVSVNKSLSTTLQAISEDDKDIKEATSIDVNVGSEALPPHDLKATVADKAYPLNGIIPPSVWKLIPFKDLSTEEDLPSFVRYRIGPVMALQDTILQTFYLRCLAYLKMLLQFKAMPPQKAQSVSATDWPEPIKEHILDSFTEKQMMREKNHIIRVFNDALEQKTICYICVLGMRVCAYNLTSDALKLLAADLRLNQTKLRLYLREIGCQSDKTKSVVTLSVPLQFEMKRRKGGKRKE
eukprot:TRINITY_DN5028_c0_g1_i1.p1 TRINITY_DN5028_c0_g1~~TRINITY_DN5028_c0_g1_i1.p1  ORF type:complete len:422 (+),score=76.97 TRINITY_DN5028_c0_g1_i1:19-1284(+)